jgi:deoxyadenosine/deoxycytidine kinase
MATMATATTTTATTTTTTGGRRHRHPFFVISIDGNIGCGKTTLLERLKACCVDHNTIQTEPVEDWNTILELDYADPSGRWSLATNLTVLQSWNHPPNHKPGGVLVCERSPAASKAVFARVGLGDLEYDLYETLFDDTAPMRAWSEPDVLIYLRVPPETCAARVIGRDRAAERTLDLAHLQKLHDAYERFVGGRTCPTHIVDGTGSPDAVFAEVRDIIVRRCAQKRLSFQPTKQKTSDQRAMEAMEISRVSNDARLMNILQQFVRSGVSASGSLVLEDDDTKEVRYFLSTVPHVRSSVTLVDVSTMTASCPGPTPRASTSLCRG